LIIPRRQKSCRYSYCFTLNGSKDYKAFITYL
jgi:hypothetical protein